MLKTLFCHYSQCHSTAYLSAETAPESTGTSWPGQRHVFFAAWAARLLAELAGQWPMPGW